MEKSLKTIAIFSSAFLVSATLLILVVAWQKVFPGHSSIDRTLPITSEGRVSARPDLGQVTLSLTSEGKDPKTIEGKNAEKVNSIIAFLKNEGVANEDIKTSEFSLQPKYYSPWDYPRIPCPASDAEGKTFPCPPINQIIVGYTITQSLAVKLRTFEKAGALLSGAIERGATQVNSLAFSVEDPDQYKKEARAIAIRKAKGQAKELADAGGFRIGKILSIQEGYSYFPQLYRQGADSTGAPNAEKTTPQVEPGSQDVFVTLTVLFQIR